MLESLRTVTFTLAEKQTRKLVIDPQSSQEMLEQQIATFC